MWEKLIGTHEKPNWIRLPSRLPGGESSGLPTLYSCASTPAPDALSNIMAASVQTPFMINILDGRWKLQRDAGQNLTAM